MSTTTTARITAENIRSLVPDVVVADATSTLGNDEELEGYDAEQVRLMEEVCIVLDEDDAPIGSASKRTCTSYTMKRIINGRSFDEKH